jgi:hypothetical protein
MVGPNYVCLTTTDSEVPGSIPGATRFSEKVGGLERGPLSLVRTIEELLQ